MPQSTTQARSPTLCGPSGEIVLTEDLLCELRDYLEASASELSRSATDRAKTASQWGRDLRGDLETLLFQQARMLLSLHIPLAEAPGFRRLLASVFGEGFFLQYREIMNCHGRVVPDLPSQVRCVHGHFGAEALLARFPEAQLITWVREPVQRVAAHYEHWHRVPDWENPLCCALHERNWSLVEFARQDAMRNETVRFFGNLRPGDFAFIGLLEAFEESVDLFMNRFHVAAVPLFNAYRSTSRGEESPPIADKDRAEIARLNESDCRLHADCQDWFQHARRPC